MSIPLVQDNQKDSINASLIAIKREEERLQALIAEADKKIAQLNELKVSKSDIVDEVTLNNMQSVTSNAVARAMNTWVDISSQVSLSFISNNARVSVGHKKVYMCGSLLKFDIYFDCNSSSLVEGQDFCQVQVSSPLFTLPYSLGRWYNSSYYGKGVTTVGMNIYENDNGVITARFTRSAETTIGDFSFCATIPCLLS